MPDEEAEPIRSTTAVDGRSGARAPGEEPRSEIRNLLGTTVQHPRPLALFALGCVARAALCGLVLALGALTVAWPTLLQVQEYNDAVRAAEEPVVGYSVAMWQRMVLVAAGVVLVALPVTAYLTARLTTGFAYALQLSAEHGPLGRSTVAGHVYRRRSPAFRVRALRGALLLALAVVAGVGYVLFFHVTSGPEPPGARRYFVLAVPVLCLAAASLLSLRYCLAPTAVALEGLSARAALRRSAELATGRRIVRLCHTFGGLVLLVMVLALARGLHTLLAAPVYGAGEALTGNPYVGNLLAPTVPAALALLACYALVVPVLSLLYAGLFLHVRAGRDRRLAQLDAL